MSENTFFQMKKFRVYHHLSSMKVGTDALLLACLSPIEDSQNILEVGCGSGIISLALAQLSKAKIQAIDIHQDSVTQANYNFSISPWAIRLNATTISLQDYISKNTEKFDHIVSNPPFFENSMKSQSKERNLARHTDTLSFREMLVAAKKLLKNNGLLSLVLPDVAAEQFILLAKEFDFFLTQKVLIYPKKSKKVNRMILSFGDIEKEIQIKELVIREENNEYTQEYREVTKDFYLAF